MDSFVRFVVVCSGLIILVFLSAVGWVFLLPLVVVCFLGVLVYYVFTRDSAPLRQLIWRVFLSHRSLDISGPVPSRSRSGVVPVNERDEDETKQRQAKRPTFQAQLVIRRLIRIIDHSLHEQEKEADEEGLPESHAEYGGSDSLRIRTDRQSLEFSAPLTGNELDDKCHEKSAARNDLVIHCESVESMEARIDEESNHSATTEDPSTRNTTSPIDVSTAKRPPLEADESLFAGENALLSKEDRLDIELGLGGSSETCNVPVGSGHLSTDDGTLEDDPLAISQNRIDSIMQTASHSLEEEDEDEDNDKFPVTAAAPTQTTIEANDGASISEWDGNDRAADEFCDICLRTYQVGDLVAWSPNNQCIHTYHKDCVLDWLMHQPTCPNCRQNYLERNISCSPPLAASDTVPIEGSNSDRVATGESMAVELPRLTVPVP